jgi:hypothetical protein
MYNIGVPSQKTAITCSPSNILLEKGTVGRIVGIRSKPELNGKFGTIIGWSETSGWYSVQLSAKEVICIKVENIRVAAMQRVQLGRTRFYVHRGKGPERRH